MRMFNSRKGVSEVVANVLIVLLVIVGIAVIWSVVKPTIDRGAEGIQADCFTVDVQPISCTADGSNYDVIVKRNPGSGSLDSVELLFESSTGTTFRHTPTTAVTLAELATYTFDNVDSDPSGSGFIPDTVNVVFTSGGQLCQVKSQPVNC